MERRPQRAAVKILHTNPNVEAFAWAFVRFADTKPMCRWPEPVMRTRKCFEDGSGTG